MSAQKTIKKIRLSAMIKITLLSLTISACFHPPYNNFTKEPPNLRQTIGGSGVGAVTGLLLGSTVVGAAIGGTAGTVIGIYRTNKHAIIQELLRDDIQFIEYGDTMTLIVPTDHFYQFNSPHFNEVCFKGLNDIIKLLRFYPCSHIYIAGFTDNIGTAHHKRTLSQAQAETMLTFLWANNIKASLLSAQGYGDRLSIGDNKLIHGSAYNRRIEIQWNTVPENTQQMSYRQGDMK